MQLRVLDTAWADCLGVGAEPGQELLHLGEVHQVHLALPELHQPGDVLRGGGQGPGGHRHQHRGRAETLRVCVTGSQYKACGGVGDKLRDEAVGEQQLIRGGASSRQSARVNTSPDTPLPSTALTWVANWPGVHLSRKAFIVIVLS